MSEATTEKANLISQEEIDELLRIHDLISDEREEALSIIDEIKDAILDSGKLTLVQWKSLRKRIKEIETLTPSIDLIIQLKEQRERRKQVLLKSMSP